MKDFALQVTKGRLKKGWTPDDLASAASLSSKTIQAIENGETRVLIGDLVKIARALDMIVDISFTSLELEEEECDQCRHPEHDGLCECGNDGGQAMTAQG